MSNLIVLFQSEHYEPGKVYDRWLHCAQDGRLIVSEHDEERSGYVVRSFVLPEEDYPHYTKIITEAKRLQRNYPNKVKLIHD